jgi:aspartokinase-like uncharacterized kinase
MTPIRVVKVGGSLFDWPLLPRVLDAWIAAQPPATNVLIAGGGALADMIRQADATFRLGEEQSHRLCVEVMGVTARLVAGLLAGRALLVDDWEKISTVRSLASCFVMDVRPFLEQVEPRETGEPLPHTWAVTSDSIAARVAVATGAQELVLLKSCQEPAGEAFGRWAATGLVDRHFPRAVRGFAGTVRVINLRDWETKRSANSQAAFRA